MRLFIEIYLLCLFVVRQISVLVGLSHDKHLLCHTKNSLGIVVSYSENISAKMPPTILSLLNAFTFCRGPGANIFHVLVFR